MITLKAMSSAAGSTLNIGKCAVVLCASAMAAAAFGAASVKPATVVDMSAGQITAQAQHYSNNDASHAFDGDTTTDAGRWIVGSSNRPMYFVYKFGTATVVDGMRVMTQNGTRAPRNWTFEGLQTGEDGSWTVLDTRTVEMNWNASETRTFSFANTTAYEYYKFNCTTNNGDAYYSIREITFLSGAPLNLATASAGGVVDHSPTVTDSGKSYPASNLFDGVRCQANSRWLAAKSSSMYFVYKFNQPTMVNAVSLFTPSNVYGTDSNTRAPKSWTFSGSNDGSTWTVLDSQANETGWSTNGEERYYQFENSTAYEYYKFDCTANNGSAQYLQLVEMEFYFINPGTPMFGNCTVVRGSDATTLDVSATVSVNGADSLAWILSDGATATTNVFATSIAEGGSASDTISGLDADKTYAVSLLAVNGAGTAEFDAGTFYTGDLVLGEATNASEGSGTAGTVAVSRAHNDPLPLTVYYTVTGNVGSQGTTWAEPVPVEIPAGQTTGYLLVTPLADLMVSDDVTVTVSLAGEGHYGIPATGSSATLTIENDSAPAGYKVISIVNALDNPDGGYFGAAYGSALNISTNTIIKFVKPESAPSGLREFSQYAGAWVTVGNGEHVFPHDWMLSVSATTPTEGATVTSVRCASEPVTGLRDRADVRTYMGSWYIPADGTYSFRMHMAYSGIFSLDGKQVLRQATASAVTTNNVALTAGWHSFYVAFVSNSNGNNSKIGPASGETLGFSYSPANADLAADPSAGQAFDGTGGHVFCTAFNSVLIPSMWASGGDVTIDCANLPGDLRVTGQIAGTGDHEFKFVNMAAGRTLEVGRPVTLDLTGPQDFNNCAYLEWPRIKLPAGVGIRFEGSLVIDGTWTQAGRGVWSTGDHSAFSLGKFVTMFTDVSGFLGTYDDEFRYPDGLRLFHAGTPDVIGTTAKIIVPDYCAFGFGGAPFALSVSGGNKKLPVTRVLVTYFNFPNNVELGTNAAVNKSLTANNGTDRISGYVDGPQASARITGYSSYMRFTGSVNVKDVNVGQLGCRTSFLPATGSAPSSISGTLSIGNDAKTYPTGGWDYCGPNFCYCPETPGEYPLTINIVNGSGAKYCPENVGPNSWSAFSHTTRQGSNLSTCSNNTVNVVRLQGSGIHLRAAVPFPGAQGFDERKYENGAGPANFVFGEINGSAAMPIFVSSNVNITVTNILKSTAFHYEVMTNGVNAAVLDIEGTVADGTTITATDVAMLPARIKGFTGEITLTDTEEKTYPVVFDFDNHGGVPVGGCDGSGTLAAAPSGGTIDLSFAGTPPDRGEWGLLRFDNVNGKLDGWTVNSPGAYTVNGKKYGIRVTKDEKGFSIALSKLGLFVTLR